MYKQIIEQIRDRKSKCETVSVDILTEFDTYKYIS